MRVLGTVAALALLAAGATMLWQHLRYVELRRNVLHDRQALIHPAEAFHVLTFLELAPGQQTLEALRKVVPLLAPGDAQVIYAGEVVLTPLASAQIPEPDWNAIVLTQHPTRDAYDAARASPDRQRALAEFARAYEHGMKRPRLFNLAIHQLLLVLRAGQILTRAPSHFPFERADGPLAVDTERLRALEAARSRDRGAVVVVNLLQEGTREQRDANRQYGLAMAGMFAEGAHGPFHMGRSVTVEGEARFDAVALVYYPGVAHFLQMGQSRFFQGIVGGKQLADTQASITIPVLDQL